MIGKEADERRKYHAMRGDMCLAMLPAQIAEARPVGMIVPKVVPVIGTEVRQEVLRFALDFLVVASLPSEAPSALMTIFAGHIWMEREKSRNRALKF